MTLHVVVGAGAVGSATAALLADHGEQVRILSRRGGGPVHPQIERVSVDACDAAALGELARGAAVLYNCAAPPYHRWLSDWPPLAAALNAAAERSGAALVSAGNLYGHGPVDGPVDQATPLDARHPKLRLRADLWRDALALHQAGRIRCAEVRASDYLEANSIFSLLMVAPLLAGRRVLVPSALDIPHSWTSIADVARTLVAVAGSTDAWGQPWPVPSQAALTLRQLATRYTELHGAAPAKLASLPYPALWLAGLFDPMAKELRATRYQFTHPFILDATATERHFGLIPTPLDQVLASIKPH